MVEYMAIPAYNEAPENQDRLNRYAKSGWRLVGVLAANRPNGSGQFILEREVEDA